MPLLILIRESLKNNHMPVVHSKPVFKQLIKLAWPIVLAFMMQNSYNLVDIFWVGKLGATAIAAVSLAGNFFILSSRSGRLSVQEL
jgi:Na+-driven multidrug efflux pump